MCALASTNNNDFEPSCHLSAISTTAINFENKYFSVWFLSPSVTLAYLKFTHKVQARRKTVYLKSTQNIYSKIIDLKIFIL